jgi:hypothetical protein
VRLYNQGSTLAATTNKRFSFANLYNYQNMQVVGMALNGFDWPSLNVLNFTAEPTYSYENNSFILTVIVDGGAPAMNVLVYNIIVVNSNYNTIVDLKSSCTVSIKFRLRPGSNKRYLTGARLHPKLQFHFCIQQDINGRDRDYALPAFDNKCGHPGLHLLQRDQLRAPGGLHGHLYPERELLGHPEVLHYGYDVPLDQPQGSAFA